MSNTLEDRVQIQRPDTFLDFAIAKYGGFGGRPQLVGGLAPMATWAPLMGLKSGPDTWYTYNPWKEWTSACNCIDPGIKRSKVTDKRLSNVLPACVCRSI